MNAINVALATDHNGVRQTCVAVKSLIESNRDGSDLTIWLLLSKDVDSGDRRQLTGLVEGCSRVEIKCVDAAGVLETYRPQMESYVRLWPLAAFTRLFVDVLLPESVKRILYIDIDTLVTDSVHSLFDLDMEGSLFGAVPEADFKTSNGRYERLCFAKDVPFYFNSGVLLMNLDEYRKTGGHEDALRILEKIKDRIITPDQDIMNYMGNGRTLALHPRWNHNDGLLVKQFTISGLPGHTYRGKIGREILEAIVSPGIIHYMGQHKPWRYNHRPERKRYARAMESLGWSTEGLCGKTFSQKTELIFFDVLHWILFRIATLRVRLGKVTGK